MFFTSRYAFSIVHGLKNATSYHFGTLVISDTKTTSDFDWSTILKCRFDGKLVHLSSPNVPLHHLELYHLMDCAK